MGNRRSKVLQIWLVLGIAVLLTQTTAWPWGRMGHRVSAVTAQSRLTPAAARTGTPHAVSRSKTSTSIRCGKTSAGSYRHESSLTAYDCSDLTADHGWRLSLRAGKRSARNRRFFFLACRVPEGTLFSNQVERSSFLQIKGQYPLQPCRTRGGGLCLIFLADSVHANVLPFGDC